MKKLIASALAAMMFSIFSPMISPVHAASIEEQLTQVMAQNVSADRVQQLLTLKKQLEQGNKQGLVEALAKAALEHSGQGDTAAVASALTQGNITQGAENALRQQVEKSITDKLAPYEKQLAIVQALFNNSSLDPKASRDNNSLLGAPQNYKRVLDMTATGYSPGTLENGRWKDKTYMGGMVRHGVVAVDPRIIPMGTKVWVEGYGEAIAEDQGSAIQGNRIDLAFDNRNEALDYGIKNVKLYVLN